MVIAPWNSRFETGIDLVDAQHQSLFAAVNQLADSFKAGNAGTQVKESLDFLIGYTQEHFQTEERFMREMEYPRLAEHTGEHARLMEQVHDLQMEFEEGKPVTMDVAIFLADWLREHIHGSDLAYVRFMKEQRQK
jgi:hemerythrin